MIIKKHHNNSHLNIKPITFDDISPLSIPRFINIYFLLPTQNFRNNRRKFRIFNLIFQSLYYFLQLIFLLRMVKPNSSAKSHDTGTRNNQLKHGILNTGLLLKVLYLNLSLDINRAENTEI